MVEEDSVAAEHAVGLPVLADDPVAVLLGDGVRTVGVERGVLVLGHLLHLAVEFGCGGLVHPARLCESGLADRLKDPQHPGRVNISRELRGVERHLNMALRRKIVHLVRTDLVHNLDQAHRVPQIGVVKMEIRLSLKVRDPLTVVHR